MKKILIALVLFTSCEWPIIDPVDPQPKTAYVLGLIAQSNGFHIEEIITQREGNIFVVSSLQGAASITHFVEGTAAFDQYQEDLEHTFQSLEAQGFERILFALDIIQGETDAGDPDRAAAWKGHILDLIDWHRLNVNPEAPVTIPKILDEPNYYTDVINGSIQELDDSDPLFGTVETRSFPRYDGVHYTEEGNQMLENALWNKRQSIGWAEIIR